MRQKDPNLAHFLTAIYVKPSNAGSAEDMILQYHEIKVSMDHHLYPKQAINVYAQNLYAPAQNILIFQD